MSHASPAPDPLPRLYDLNFLLASLVALLCTLPVGLLFHFSRLVKFLGGDDQTAGWISGLPLVLVLPLWPYIGLLLDRRGITRMWSASLLVVAAAVGVWSLWPTLGWPVYAMRVATQVGMAVAMAAISSYAAATSPASRRNEAIASMGVGGFVAMIAAPAVGDWIIGPEGTRTLAGFQHLLWAAAGSCVLGAVVAAMLRPTERHHRGEPLDLTWPWRRLAAHWPGRALLPAIALGLSLLGNSVFLGLFADQRGMAHIAWYFVTYPLVGLLVRLLGRRLPTVLGTPRLAAIGTALYVAAWLSMLALPAGQSWTLVVPGLLGGLAHGVMFPSAIYLIVRRLPAENASLGVSAALAMLDLGAIVGGPLLGAVASHLGYSALFLLLAGLVGGLGVAGVWREKQ